MSQGLENDDLVIQWKMTNPSIHPKQWHEWKDAGDFSRSPLETQLGWTAGSIQILESAFRLGIGRSTGWKIPTGKSSEAYRRAASIFRRGIAFSDQIPEDLLGQYSIRIRDELPLAELMTGQRPLVIDQQLAKAWNIPHGPQFRFIALDERRKTLESVALLLNWLEGQSSGPIDIIGGGLLADTAAFAAALVQRPFRLVPTTLLAMLDACIGGKTGVNFPPFGKNQLGLFAFPEEVLISPRWLETLPPREINAGLAEGFKHTLLSGDRNLAAKIAAFDPSKESIAPYLKKLIQVKADIVEQDPAEQGLRAVLNLGHTLAHAVERIAHACGSDLLHGEAVGVGLLFMLEMSREKASLPPVVYEEIRGLLRDSVFLIPRKELERKLKTNDLSSVCRQMVEGIALDKKNEDRGSSEWVLLSDWGKPLQRQGRYTTAVAHDEFRRVYDLFLKRWN